jgi:hypothetical protein
MFRLTIKDASGSRQVAIDRAEAVIGRRESADVVLEEGAAANSHCLLRRQGSGALLVDLGSAGGTRVNGRRVEQASVQAGDEILIGETVISVDSCGAPPLAIDEPAEAGGGAAPAPVPSGAKEDFGREVRALVRQAPWYVISLAFHILLLLVLDLIPFRATLESPHRPIAAISREKLSALEEDDPGELEPDLDQLRPPEVPEEDLIEEQDEAGESDAAEGNPDWEPSSADPSFKIGPADSLARRIPPLALPNDNSQAGERIDRSNLEGEQGAARKAVLRGMGDGIRTLRGISSDRILVIEGDFDKMELVLDLYRIPHTIVSRKSFTSRRSLSRARVVCVNCARRPTAIEKHQLLPRIKEFVRGGGWLLTSDWAVDPYLTGTWPGYVKVVSLSRHQPDTTVTVRSLTPDSPLLKGVFRHRHRTLWWLEETSTFFRARHPKVRVLVTSDDARKRFGTGDVVIEFRPGRGRVLHLLGHYYQKDGNRRGLVGMHRLILNYLRDRFAPRGS